MSQMITAIYEDGVLRPLTPLELPEHAEVQIRVESSSESSAVETHRRAVDEALIATGPIVPPAVDQPGVRPLTNDERDALSRLISAGHPLSEIILEERDGR